MRTLVKAAIGFGFAVAAMSGASAQTYRVYTDAPRHAPVRVVYERPAYVPQWQVRQDWRWRHEQELRREEWRRRQEWRREHWEHEQRRREHFEHSQWGDGRGNWHR
jgi:hypothetical protein